MLKLNVKNFYKARWSQLDYEVFLGMLMSLNERCFVGLRDKIIFVIIALTGCKLNDLWGFKLKNWDELYDRGYTFVDIDDVKGGKLTDKVLLRIKDEKREILKKIYESSDFFGKSHDLYLLRTEEGKRLNTRYIAMHLNRVLKDNIKAEQKITLEKVRKVSEIGINLEIKKH
jgi:hypothetical protein